ncbi:MAG: 1-deoxy-D-xylulose-5-phosphate reductoisomerase [Sphingomonas bacterium]|nr:1-deoxy-D-xylulose-5-phosphate reductoisomerase [Sphingomonas bacterium]
MKRRISILGATGSVGTSTLDLVERHPDRFEVIALTAATNAAALADCARRTGAKLAVITDERKFDELRDLLAGSGCRAATGHDAMLEAAAGDAEWVMAAIVGCAGLEPVMAAVEAGRTIALANKEALVTAGWLMTDAAKRAGATILPVDSEHNAIFQCLAGNSHDGVAKLILTASGGPFRTWTKADMDVARPEQALAHPNWSMGAKISIDSATMMNKGLELIEAHHLFGLSSARIDILVHPQSVIHSMVEYVDGSVIAQLGSPDMRIPIAHALAWPERITTRAETLDLIKIATLSFEPPDEQRFPSLRLARAALESGKGEAIVLNAANELAVAAFLDRRIAFGDIARIVERAIEETDAPAPSSIAEVIDIDQSVRHKVGESLSSLVA